MIGLLNKDKARNGNKQSSRQAFRGQSATFEKLEERQMLAFAGSVVDGVLQVEQTADDSHVLIHFTGFAYEFSDVSGQYEFEHSGDATITMLDHSNADVNLQALDSLIGNLTLHLGEGQRELGLGGDIQGDVTITAGGGPQTVYPVFSAELAVHGDLLIDLGAGEDVVRDLPGSQPPALMVLGNMTLVEVGTVLFHSTPVTVNGNFTAEMANVESRLPRLEFFNSDNQFIGDFTVAEGACLDAGVQNVSVTAAIGGDVDVALCNGNSSDVFFSGVHTGGIANFFDGLGRDRFVWRMASDAAITVLYENGNTDILPEFFTLKTPVGSLDLTFADDNADFDIDLDPNVDVDFPVQARNWKGFDLSFDPNQSRATFAEVSEVEELRFEILGVRKWADNFDVSFMDNSQTPLYIAAPIAGDFIADLGNGDRFVSIEYNNGGEFLMVGGALALESGDGAQLVQFGRPTSQGERSVGELFVDLGGGLDEVRFGGFDWNFNEMQIFSADRFDSQNTSQITVAGNVNIDNSDTSLGTLIPDMSIGGDFVFSGGSGNDTVRILETNTIGGNINLSLRDGDDIVLLEPTFSGQSIYARGNGGDDQVTLNFQGSKAVANIRLDNGNDKFVLGESVSLGDLRVDFSSGQSEFVNNYGNFDFGARLLNLKGFDTTYDLPTGNLDLIQKEDRGEVFVDDGGINNALRYISDGELIELTQANDFRVILLSESVGNLTADLTASAMETRRFNCGMGLVSSF